MYPLCRHQWIQCCLLGSGHICLRVVGTCDLKKVCPVQKQGGCTPVTEGHPAQNHSEHKTTSLISILLKVRLLRCTGHLTESPAGNYFMLLAEKCFITRGHFYSFHWVLGVNCPGNEFPLLDTWLLAQHQLRIWEVLTANYSTQSPYPPDMNSELPLL